MDKRYRIEAGDAGSEAFRDEYVWGLRAEIKRLKRDPGCKCNCHDQPASKEAMGLEEHACCYECAVGLFVESERSREAECEALEAAIARLTALIERHQTEHWNMGACRCWFCAAAIRFEARGTPLIRQHYRWYTRGHFPRRTPRAAPVPPS